LLTYSLGGNIFDPVYTDVVVGPAWVKMGASFVPCKGGATEVLLWLEGNIVGVDRNFLDVLEVLLAGEVQNFDSLLGTNNEPVELLGEKNAVNWCLAVTGGEELACYEVPDHNLTVTGAWSEVGRTVDHIKGVDLSLVASEGVHESHVKVVPDLDGLVPGSSHADCWFSSVVELDARDSIGVLVLINGVFAFWTGVPYLDLVIKATSDDLSIISWKSNWKNILRVTNETGDSLAWGNVPKTDWAIPWGGESVTGVTSQADLADEVRVA